MRKQGGRVKKANGGSYTGGMYGNPGGFVQQAFGTASPLHLQTAGMMATGDTINRYNELVKQNPAFAVQPQKQAPPAAATQQAAAPAQPAFRSDDPTAAGRFLDYLYHQEMGRRPDDAGKQYWAQQMAKGLTPAQMRGIFNQSAEGMDYDKAQAAIDAQEAQAAAAAGPPPREPTPYELSQQYFMGPRAPGSMPGSMVPSLQRRNEEMLRYQMSPEAQAADQMQNDIELLEKQAIINANMNWQKAEDERLAELGVLQKEQAAAREQEDAIRRQKEAEAAAAQQQALMLMLMMRR